MGMPHAVLGTGPDVFVRFGYLITRLALCLVESAADRICGVMPSAMYFALNISPWIMVMSRSTALQLDLSILPFKLFDRNTRDHEKRRGVGLVERETLRLCRYPYGQW